MLVFRSRLRKTERYKYNMTSENSRTLIGQSVLPTFVITNFSGYGDSVAYSYQLLFINNYNVVNQ